MSRIKTLRFDQNHKLRVVDLGAAPLRYRSARGSFDYRCGGRTYTHCFVEKNDRSQARPITGYVAIAILYCIVGSVSAYCLRALPAKAVPAVSAKMPGHAQSQAQK